MEYSTAVEAGRQSKIEVLVEVEVGMNVYTEYEVELGT